MLLSAAEGLRRRIGSPLQRFEQPEREALVKALRVHLGDRGFDRAWVDGQQLHIGAAIDLAGVR
jgi:hypothetical protein